jgi:hypothetical protein
MPPDRMKLTAFRAGQSAALHGIKEPGPIGTVPQLGTSVAEPGSSITTSVLQTLLANRCATYGGAVSVTRSPVRPLGRIVASRQ